MASKATTSGNSGTPPSREDRLKAALKANIARRKAQAAARSPQDGVTNGGSAGNKDSPKG
jgi:hypothetical protein